MNLKLLPWFWFLFSFLLHHRFTLIHKPPAAAAAAALCARPNHYQKLYTNTLHVQIHTVTQSFITICQFLLPSPSLVCQKRTSISISSSSLKHCARLGRHSEHSKGAQPKDTHPGYVVCVTLPRSSSPVFYIAVYLDYMQSNTGIDLT